MMWQTLARYRVTLGFLFGALCLWLARPSANSLQAGGALLVAGEALRIWAAGHIDKSREITRSGPYRWTRHPLYMGSTIMAVGFAIAARSIGVALLVFAYMIPTLLAAMRTEEQMLDQKFEGAYSAYREGRAAPTAKRFRWSQVMANREYRAATGVVIGLVLLAWRLRP